MKEKIIEKIEDQIEYSNKDLLKDIWKYIRPYKVHFVLGSFVRLFGDIANLYPAIALSSIVTFFGAYQMGASINTFWILIGLWAVSAIARIIGNYSGKYIIYQIAEKAALDSQLAVLKHLYALDISWHERENVGNRLKKLQRGGQGVDRIIRIWVNNYIEIAVNFIGVLIILSLTDWFITSLMIFYIISYFLISFYSLRRLTEIVKHINQKEEDMSGLVYQSLNNIRSVKISNISKKIHEMVRRQSDDMLVWIRRRVLGFQVRGVALNSWSILFRLFATILIAISIVNGRSDVGFLILFNVYFMRITESVSELSNTTQDLIINKLSIARMEEILKSKDVDSDQAIKKFPTDWQVMTVKNLSFSYGVNHVLNDISFEIKRGERIGIVGLSGTGKSTLFKLLLKENENYEGDILFDGVSLKDINKSDYYKKVGVVLQDTEVFNFSLRENIVIAAGKRAKKSDLDQALSISNVDDFLPRLPEGLNSYIGEKGVKLSGGEKQRLGIARAVYKNPQILFLDEATSHLDLESEEKIKESLAVFFQKVTAIVVAHRLTTIREMDRIILIDGGRIGEMGSFEELMAKKGRFWELWNKQIL